MSPRSPSIDLPPEAPSVPAARHLVEEVLRAWGVPHDRGDAALLVTELVANVVDHVQGDANLTLELMVSDTRLRIAVVDGRPSGRSFRSCRTRGPGAAGCAWSSRSPTAGEPTTATAANASGSTSDREPADRRAGLPPPVIGDGLLETAGRERGSRAMSEPTSNTEAAGEGVSDEEMVETVAEQTDSASENADTAGKNWNGDPSEAPAPDDRG
jgi:NACalpha-BTF3-like transcription factor